MTLIAQNIGIKPRTLKEIIRDEYKKCAMDPVYFMRKYCTIQHPQRGKILFDLFGFQEKVLTEFQTKDYNIVLKSRQLGLSTLVAGYSLWLMLFHSDKNILVIATKQGVAKNLVTKVRVMYKGLPSWLRVVCTEDNKLSLAFSNGSMIKAESSAPESGRSEALSLLVLDEAAFIRDISEIWAASSMTLATGGRAIILSCVTADTFIFTERGLKTVGDFVVQSKIGSYKTKEYSILGVNSLRNGNLFHNNGYVDTKIIETKFSNIEGSFNHKLWACKDGMYNWYRLDELKLGDYVSLQYGMKIFGNNDDISEFKPVTSMKHKNIYLANKIDKYLSYLFGLYISEGSSYKVLNDSGKCVGGCITITCGDDISWIFNKLNLTYSYDGKFHYTVSSKTLFELFEYVGFDMTRLAHSKKIPDKLLEMSRENIQWLLRGIYDGDGCSGKSFIQLTSTSLELIQQVRMVLNNFGILCSLQKYDKFKMNLYGGIKHNYDSYVLETYGKNALKFYNEIGFNLERKQKNKIRLSKSNFKRTTSNDVIPDTLNLCKRMYELSGETTTSLRETWGLNINGIVNKKRLYKTNDISRENVILLYNLFSNKLKKEELEYWNRVIDDNIVWVKIKNISNSKNLTYDFSLPNSSDAWSHSVIYNGFIGHQTPNGVGNFFHKTWVAAEEGTSVGTTDISAGEGVSAKSFLFNCIKLPWFVHPERNQAWRDKQTEILGARMAAQECDADFISSGNTVIEGEILKWYSDTYVKEPIEKEHIDHNFWVWEYPNYTKTYIVSADVSRGDGTDYSSCQVLDVDNCEQVAEYKGMISTKDFGNFLVSVATRYNDALLVIENSNMGWAVIQQVIERGYKNLFYSSSDMMKVDVQAQLQRNWDMRDQNNTQKLVAGVTMGPNIRTLVVSKIDEYFRSKGIIVKSKRTIAELFTWIWNAGRADHMAGYNDDLIIATGLGLLVRDTALKLKQRGIELQKKMLDGVTKTQGIYTPSMRLTYNPWEMTVRGIPEKLDWLSGESLEDAKKRFDAERKRLLIIQGNTQGDETDEAKEPESIMPPSKG